MRTDMNVGDQCPLCRGEIIYVHRPPSRPADDTFPMGREEEDEGYMWCTEVGCEMEWWSTSTTTDVRDPCPRCGGVVTIVFPTRPAAWDVDAGLGPSTRNPIPLRDRSGEGRALFQETGEEGDAAMDIGSDDEHLPPTNT